jgi:membrane protein YdbS with pleckstrin-like domain
MIQDAKLSLLRVLRIPAEPEPPAGAPDSIRVFRAAPNYYKLKLVKWAAGQAMALVGVLLAIPVLWSMDFGDTAVLLRLFEAGAVIMYFVQLPFTYLMVRFDYEMRWYIVTDRSLRIRYGIQHVREMTMTFANIQQITVQQGPLQRMLGIADLQVRTAGGGSSDSSSHSGSHSDATDSMHVGFFRGVQNATEIRDLMLARLRHWQDAGLGDPDDLAPAIELESGVKDSSALDAARLVLAEARALREVVETLPGQVHGVAEAAPIASPHTPSAG